MNQIEELKKLYEIAKKASDIGMALEILERIKVEEKPIEVSQLYCVPTFTYTLI